MRTENAADKIVEALIESRFDALMEMHPAWATALGVHAHDGRLADLSRAAKETDIAAERRFVDDLEAVDPDPLSESVRFERELALHAARLRLFDAEVVRGWERSTSATDEIGTALFLLAARDFAPLEERLVPLTERIEGIPDALLQVRDRLGDQPVRLWLELEEVAAGELPLLVHEIVGGADGVWPAGSAQLRQLHSAARAARAALFDYTAWIETQLDRRRGPHGAGGHGVG